VIEALRSRKLDHLTVVEAPVNDLAEQLREELSVSRRHLRAVLVSYRDHHWRRTARATRSRPRITSGERASAMTDLSDAIASLRT